MSILRDLGFAQLQEDEINVCVSVSLSVTKGAQSPLSSFETHAETACPQEDGFVPEEFAAVALLPRKDENQDAQGQAQESWG